MKWAGDVPVDDLAFFLIAFTWAAEALIFMSNRSFDSLPERFPSCLT
jgi:hypothetical protein